VLIRRANHGVDIDIGHSVRGGEAYVDREEGFWSNLLSLELKRSVRVGLINQINSPFQNAPALVHSVISVHLMMQAKKGI